MTKSEEFVYKIIGLCNEYELVFTWGSEHGEFVVLPLQPMPCNQLMRKIATAEDATNGFKRLNLDIITGEPKPR